MCIIVAVEHRKDFPDETIITECMNRNRHGAGIMYVGTDNRVHIAKGFNSPKEVMDSIQTIPEESAVVFHARIATHGAVVPENCHPFPIIKDDDALRLTRLSCYAGFAHNGTFSEYSRASVASGFPDSVEFMRDVIVPIVHDIENDSVQLLLRRIVSWSKIAILTHKSLLLFGDFIKDGEVRYSNGTYKPYVAPVYVDAMSEWEGGYYHKKRKNKGGKGNVLALTDDRQVGALTLVQHRQKVLQRQYGLKPVEAAALVEEGTLWD